MRIVVFLFVFLIGMVAVTAQLVNTQYSEDNQAIMQIEYSKPVIVRQDGLQRHFKHDMIGMGNDRWLLETCPLPGRDSLPPQSMNGLKHVPFLSELGNPHLPSHVDMSGGCVRVNVTAKKGERFRVGQSSTVIEMQSGQAQFVVAPENQFCDGKYCQSHIYITNLENESIHLNSLDLRVSIGIPHNISTEIVGVQRDVLQNYTIMILPNATQDFLIEAFHQEYDTTVKYNVSVWYQGTEYLLDPFFISPLPSNDVSAIGYQQQSFFAAMIDIDNNTVVLGGYNTTGAVFMGPVIVQTGIDAHSRVKLEWLTNDSFALAWVNGTVGSGLNNVNAVVYNATTQSALTGIETIHADLGDYVDLDIAGFDDSVVFCLMGDATDDVDVTQYTHDLTELVDESGNEVDVAANPSFEKHNLVACDSVGDKLGVSWFDSQATNSAKYAILHPNLTMIYADQTLDAIVGNTAQITEVDLSNEVVFIAWHDASANRFEIASVNVTDNTLINTTVQDIFPSVASRIHGAAIRENVFDTTFEAVGGGYNDTHLRAGILDQQLQFLIQGIRIEKTATLNLFEIFSHDVSSGRGICSGKFGVIKTNETGNTSVSFFTDEGADWDGICMDDCPEDWVEIPQTCFNLKELKFYEDTNECGTTFQLPPDNGTFVDCTLFDCQANPNIPFERNMEWLCQFPNTSIANSYNCGSFITQGDEFISTQPSAVYVEGFGTVNSFRERNHLVNVRFNTENLKRAQTYNFTVSCHNVNSTEEAGAFTLETTPRDVLFTDWGIGRTIWVVQNIWFIAGAAILSIIALLLFAMYKRVVA